MINNIELIKPLLNFSEEGDFYHLMILVRKKDQPEGEKDNHQSVRTIKTYCINSVEYLDKRFKEIVGLCEMFKARAYIHVQKQNHKDISLEMLSTLATKIKNGANNQKGLFDSIVGKIPTKEKRWIIDVDSKDLDFLNCILRDLPNFNPKGDKLEATIPTKNGFHLVTSKFDVVAFNKCYPTTDVVKKNPTLLYFPNSLDLD